MLFKRIVLEIFNMLTLPPLSLYIHFPWCIRKCPYCDFNSHTLVTALPEKNYMNRMLNDLEQDLEKICNRPILSIFMGGGTPSLFSPEALNYLLTELAKRLEFSVDIEITLEANPGATDYSHFSGYREAGITRLSLGIQSFSTEKLKILGRIHNGDEAFKAVSAAKIAGFTNINLDLMHGLPQQRLTEGLEDLRKAVLLEPTHISWYQLTVEPNTEFYLKPPQLPTEEEVWELQEKGKEYFQQKAYTQYEISALSKKRYRCVHNLNYWQFGDYIGIGAGAHSKITDCEKKIIRRTRKLKNPKAYLAQKNDFLAEEKIILDKDLPFEFMLNALRLHQKIPIELFQQRTGLTFSSIEALLQHAYDQGLLTYDSTVIETTELGKRFYNNLVSLFI
ncbi:radical SAM family heme chaperone HemW [Rickettsiella grylli]|uniref:Heme chaperone HemW n=1 Tax=Rickettsiella grylli TaxID=59196 RepID=A8PPA1_9COXI|nr:radical SAM family heme chaperone HemW [Rickettsiella grylli]EDP46622.1 putative oxygen-independent coproporphyrinogen III oxidase [Rickettsiella grylli]